MVRRIGNKLVKDNRRFYTFKHMDGHLVETKSVSRKEAKEHIEKSLEIKLEEAA